jgi:hypothetical protein
VFVPKIPPILQAMRQQELQAFLAPDAQATLGGLWKLADTATLPCMYVEQENSSSRHAAR